MLLHFLSSPSLIFLYNYISVGCSVRYNLVIYRQNVSWFFISFGMLIDNSPYACSLPFSKKKWVGLERRFQLLQKLQLIFWNLFVVDLLLSNWILALTTEVNHFYSHLVSIDNVLLFLNFGLKHFLFYSFIMFLSICYIFSLPLLVLLSIG